MILRNTTHWLLVLMLAVLPLLLVRAELAQMNDLYRRSAMRVFRKPKTAAWVYTAALKKGKSAKYLYAGLTTSISSLLQHNTEWPVVVILDGDGVGPELPQVLKALGVAQVLHVDRDLMPRHPLYGEVINQANINAPEHYFGYVGVPLEWLCIGFFRSTVLANSLGDNTTTSTTTQHHPTQPHTTPHTTTQVFQQDLELGTH